MDTCKLTELCRIQYGYAFDSASFTEDTSFPPLVRIRDVKRGFSETYYSGNYSEEYIVRRGDILIGMDGEFNIARWQSEPALLNQRVCKIIPNQQVDGSYLLFALTKILKKIEDKTAFVTVKHLSAKELNKIELRIPNYEQQMQISSTLEKALSIISRRQYQLAKLDELVKCRFVEMFGDPVTNSKSWQLEKLADLGELARGISKFRPRNAPFLLNGPYPLIQTGDISNAGTYITGYSSSYSEEGLKQSKLWPSGTLVITIAANIAETSILTFPACFPDSVVGFIAKENRVSTLFIHYWFTFFQQKLEHDAPQVAQKNINLKILSELLVIVPPMEIQHSFVTFVRRIDKLRFGEIKTGIEGKGWGKSIDGERERW